MEDEMSANEIAIKNFILWLTHKNEHEGDKLYDALELYVADGLDEDE